MKKLNFIRIIVISSVVFICILSITIFISPEYFLSIQKEKQIAPSNRLGQSQYLAYCSSCHGSTGTGNGPSAITLKKTPPNILDKKNVFINGFNQNGLSKTLNEGIPNSQMPSFNYLPEDVKKSIIEYLFFLRDKAM